MNAIEEISDDKGACAAHEIMDEVNSIEDWFEKAIERDDKMLELVNISDSEDKTDKEMPGLEEVSDSEDEDKTDDEMPGLEEVSNSEDEGDEGMDLEEEAETLVVEEFNKGGAEDLDDASGEVLISMESISTAGVAELYDSGCTNHISPYRNQFQNFKEIIPRYFHAAKKQSFSTVGKGDLVIDVPNSIETSQLCLTEVLYTHPKSATHWC